MLVPNHPFWSSRHQSPFPSLHLGCVSTSSYFGIHGGMSSLVLLGMLSMGFDFAILVTFSLMGELRDIRKLF